MRAFSIIEAVVSIMVLSIAFASISTIIQTSNKANWAYEADETSNRIKIIANDIFTRYWDSCSYNADMIGGGYKICDTQSSNGNLGRVGNNRVGDFLRGEGSRGFYPSTTYADAMPSNNSTYTAQTINFINNANGAFINQDGVEYKITASYISDAITYSGNSAYADWSNLSPLQATSNLKRVTIKATKPNGQTLSSTLYRSNIGSVELLVK